MQINTFNGIVLWFPVRWREYGMEYDLYKYFPFESSGQRASCSTYRGRAIWSLKLSADNWWCRERTLRVNTWRSAKVRSNSRSAIARSLSLTTCPPTTQLCIKNLKYLLKLPFTVVWYRFLKEEYIIGFVHQSAVYVVFLKIAKVQGNQRNFRGTGMVHVIKILLATKCYY